MFKSEVYIHSRAVVRKSDKLWLVYSRSFERTTRCSRSAAYIGTEQSNGFRFHKDSPVPITTLSFPRCSPAMVTTISPTPQGCTGSRRCSGKCMVLEPETNVLTSIRGGSPLAGLPTVWAILPLGHPSVKRSLIGLSSRKSMASQSCCAPIGNGQQGDGAAFVGGNVPEDKDTSYSTSLGSPKT